MNDLKDILSRENESKDIVDGTIKTIKTSDRNLIRNPSTSEVVDEASISEFLGETETVEKSVYDREWTQLEKGIKLNRLQEYVINKRESNNLDDAQTLHLKNLVFKMCNDGLLNKANIVSYENEKIIDIKVLDYEDGEYKLKKQAKKVRTTPKSKSNLDRLFKKKKG